jgi:hypothetical protein
MGPRMTNRTRKHESKREQEQKLQDDALVDEMSEESFPTSDPPSTWAGRDHRSHQ